MYIKKANRPASAKATHTVATPTTDTDLDADDLQAELDRLQQRNDELNGPVRPTWKDDAQTVNAVKELRPLILREDQCRWEIGDKLNELGLTRGRLALAAQVLNRKVSTLEHYRELAREFPAPDKVEPGHLPRNTKLAQGIFDAMLPIPETERVTFFAKKKATEWTQDSARAAVQEYNNSAGSKPKRGVTDSGGIKLGDKLLKGTLHDQLVMKVVVDGDYDAKVDNSVPGETTIILTPITRDGV